MRRYFFVIILTVCCGMAIPFLTNVSAQNFSAEPPISKILDVNNLLEELTLSLVDIFSEEMQITAKKILMDAKIESSFEEGKTEFIIHIIITPKKIMASNPIIKQ